MVARNDLALWLASCLMLSLRVTPLFVIAPPFTLTRVPRLLLWLFGLGISATLVGALPQNALLQDLRLSTLVIGSVRELALGLVPVLALHLMFAGLYVVGRMIDIQSGFGLALLIDPTTRTQKPVVGTLFAMLAAAMFFAMNGHHELLRFLAASLELVPLAAGHDSGSLSALSSYLFVTFLTAFGVGAATIVALFLADLSIAMLSRTVPQMNALLLGIEVKAILIIFTLPISISVSAVMLAQMANAALRVMARLV
jgi:flagellar biosynthesis protein FliR